MTEKKPIPTSRWVIVGALTLAAAGSIAAMALMPPKTEPQGNDASPPGLPPLSRSTTPAPPTSQPPMPRAVTPQSPDGRPQPTVRPLTDHKMIDELNADLAAGMGPPGEPWEYNPVTNKHWDPRKDHGHWHDGPPPKVGEDGQPIPWYYDPKTNKHWDPRPGHEHWHDGPVPDKLPQ